MKKARDQFGTTQEDLISKVAMVTHFAITTYAQLVLVLDKTLQNLEELKENWLDEWATSLLECPIRLFGLLCV